MIVRQREESRLKQDKNEIVIRGRNSNCIRDRELIESGANEESEEWDKLKRVE